MEERTKKKTVLLLGDVTGRSRVAVRMITSVLEERGIEVLALPTALISNTFSMGAHAQLDTTDYLTASLQAWEKLGIAYDFVVIGYITGMRQAQVLAGFADRVRERGIPVMLDPILGDHGKRYPSVTQEQQDAMWMLLHHVDLITPNATEALLLSGLLCEEPWEKGRFGRAIDVLSQRPTGRSVLITGAADAEGNEAIIGWEKKPGATYHDAICIPIRRVPGSFGGTGDLFTALLVDALLRDLSLKDAAQFASYAVEDELRKPKSRYLPELGL